MRSERSGAGPTSKTASEAPIEPPIAFAPNSNGEYLPLPVSPRAARAHERWRRIVEDTHGRLGMTRRQFAESACGLAASMLVLNQAACDGPGGSAGDTGSGGASGRDAGSGGAASEADAGQPADAGYYDVTPDMIEDRACAEELLYQPDEFVFDVQTHSAIPLAPWAPGSPSQLAVDFMKVIFVQGGTTVACISGTPDARNGGAETVRANTDLREILARIGGDRLRLHANIDFSIRGRTVEQELDFMAQLAERYPVGAWKVYPYGEQWLASQEVGLRFAEQARRLGIPVIAAHRGIAGNGGYTHGGSPRDLVQAAAQTPEVKYLCYHSGWEGGTNEAHPYDPAAPAASLRGVDRFIRAIEEFRIPRNTGNVYAELGSTWNYLRANPDEAAHVLGKLLRYLGEDRILYGTDCLFHGSPAGQIAALRSFQIPARLQEAHGYPALTPEIRRKILGLNAAPIYGVDPRLARCRFGNDEVDALRMAYLHDPRAVPMPHPHTYLGPRNRREFFAFLDRESAHESRRPGA